MLVNLAKTYVNDNLPSKSWPIILGGLFILVVVFLPDGILGVLRQDARPRIKQLLALRKRPAPYEVRHARTFTNGNAIRRTATSKRASCRSRT